MPNSPQVLSKCCSLPHLFKSLNQVRMQQGRCDNYKLLTVDYVLGAALSFLYSISCLIFTRTANISTNVLYYTDEETQAQKLKSSQNITHPVFGINIQIQDFNLVPTLLTIIPSASLRQLPGQDMCKRNNGNLGTLLCIHLKSRKIDLSNWTLQWVFLPRKELEFSILHILKKIFYCNHLSLSHLPEYFLLMSSSQAV